MGMLIVFFHVFEEQYIYCLSLSLKRCFEIFSFSYPLGFVAMGVVGCFW